MADSPRLKGSGVVRVTVFSNGAEIKDEYKLFHLSVFRRVNRIPSAKIEFLDGDMAEGTFPVSDGNDFKPGAEIKINAGYDDQEETIFEGVVTKHGLRITGGPSPRLVVECRDKAVKMTIGRKNANYINKKDSDIISKLIGDSGLASDAKATSVTYKELVQYYCTDWDYMLSRAEVNGRIVLVEDGKVIVNPPETGKSAVLTVTYGEDVIEFNADMDVRSQLKKTRGATWDPAAQAVVDKTGKKPTLNEQGNLQTDALSKVIGLDTYNIQTSAPLDPGGLQDWADAQLLKSGLSRITGRMKFQGSAKAMPGKIIELKGVGERFNGNVFVSGVFHEFIDGGWTSKVDFGLESSWFMEKPDILAPPASGFLPGVEGLQIGKVLKLDADPEGQHKVQVSIPVMHNETEGVWARLAKFYASSDIGSFFIPEIGDEVVIGYINNDPGHPIILGSLYSSKINPPYKLTADNFIKAVVTRSKLILEFDDENKIITVITPAKNKMVFSDKDKSILVQDETGNKIELNTGGIVIDSPKDIKISAKGKITIDAAQNVETTAKMDVKVNGLNVTNEAKVGFTAKGNATAELSAAGQTTVKGAMVMIN
ncbi:MAG: type VI secretion system tip protein VgrG [Proteobacteria bacterium]|nr:type VI secretion system tip protein VgrG [Pseudomonadota bacterium]